MREFETVHGARHVDVGKHDTYVFAPFQKRNRLVGVRCFNCREAGVFDKGHGVQSAKKIVFYNQDMDGKIG